MAAKDITCLYKKLNNAKKTALKKSYTNLFGCKSTFYNKVMGKGFLKNAEILFFANYLNNEVTLNNI